MTGLRLAPDLELPLDFATEGIVVIGVRGSGKSNTEVRYAEQLHANGIPFVAIDPKGDWYGIRMDGKSPGLPIPVFGGLYGDFPIDERLGARIADLLVDNNISAVIDVSRMSHGARARFLTEFFKQLMERHQVEPHVRTVIFEEAHRYIPQTVSGPVAALKEAAAAVLLEGRSFGLGCWACTQRPARLHNDVLEEVDTAIIHRIGVTATADLKRVRDWVKHEELGDEISASLTKLKAGEAWVLSPVSLGIVQRVQIDRRTTYDSGATPVVGSEGAMKRRLSTMADIDAPAIKEALADAIETAKEKDPVALTKRIRDLEKQLADRPAETVTVEVPVEVEVPVLDPELVSRIETATGPLIDGVQVLIDYLTQTRHELAVWQGYTTQPQRTSGPEKTTTAPVTGRTSGNRGPTATAHPQATPPHERARRPAGDGTLPGPQQKILDALAWWNTIGVTNPSRVQVAFVAGYGNIRSKGFVNPLGTLNTSGLIRYVGRGHIALTDEGAEHAQPPDAYPTPEAFQEIVFGLVSNVHTKILRPLIDAYPHPIERDELAARTGYTNPRSKGFVNPLGRLRTLGFIEYPESGTVVATGLLFLEASDV